MSWAIVQYDNRELDEHSKIILEKNKLYCKKHGYTHIFETKHYDLPPWWIKVFLVKQIIETKKYKGVLWLDTDAVIHRHDISLDDFLIDGVSFYYSSDIPLWHVITSTDGVFNAGVWLVVNDTNGRQILETWSLSYNSSDWNKNGDKWTTKGKWAGDTYEQGALIKYVIPKFHDTMREYPWQVFQSFRPGPNTFVLHFSGDMSDTLLPIYNNMYALINIYDSYKYFIIAFFTLLICGIFAYIFRKDLYKIGYPGRYKRA